MKIRLTSLTDSDRKIKAIVELREATRVRDAYGRSTPEVMGLREAKEIIEDVQAGFERIVTVERPPVGEWLRFVPDMRVREEPYLLALRAALSGVSADTLEALRIEDGPQAAQILRSVTR